MRSGDPKKFRPVNSESPIRYTAPPPGEQRVMKRLDGEGPQEAIKRAKLMPWWPLVISKTRNPHATGMFWIFKISG